MPIYEFRCEKCGTITETIQKNSDPAPHCKKCGAEAMIRQISNTSFVLKGTGWYATDYAGKKSSDIGSGSGSTSGSGTGSAAD
jgi:putative FmdB family regulatory protein